MYKAIHILPPIATGLSTISIYGSFSSIQKERYQYMQSSRGISEASLFV